MKKYYAGIGSRETPIDVCNSMTEIATKLEQCGYILRSGRAKGADKAFEAGVLNPSNKEIFHAKYPTSDLVREVAATIHPAWHNCSEYAKNCHARNVYQVLGEDLKTPVEFVICWTPKGKEIGGTRTSMVLAKRKRIPVYNLAVESKETILSQILSY